MQVTTGEILPISTSFRETLECSVSMSGEVMRGPSDNLDVLATKMPSTIVPKPEKLDSGQKS